MGWGLSKFIPSEIRDPVKDVIDDVIPDEAKKIVPDEVGGEGLVGGFMGSNWASDNPAEAAGITAAILALAATGGAAAGPMAGAGAAGTGGAAAGAGGGGGLLSTLWSAAPTAGTVSGIGPVANGATFANNVAAAAGGGGGGAGGGFFSSSGGGLIGAGLISSLGSLGQNLMAQGVTEDKLELERDRLALQQQQLAETSRTNRASEAVARERIAMEKEKVKLEVAIAAIRQAKEQAPDPTATIAALANAVNQRQSGRQQQMNALQALAANFANAIR